MDGNFTHKGSYDHVPGYAEIHFQQELDGDGWELDLSPAIPGDLSPFARSVMGGGLVYRRGDEWATVPNIPYNQPAQWRADYLRFCAARSREGAAKQRLEGKSWSEHEARKAERRADELDAEALRLEREGNGRTIGNFSNVKETTS